MLSFFVSRTMVRVNQDSAMITHKHTPAHLFLHPVLDLVLQGGGENLGEVRLEMVEECSIRGLVGLCGRKCVGVHV